MTDSTNNSFENQWQHAFDDAELTPPASVWEKIELGLTPENTPPSKPNFGNKPYYFLGGILVGLLGLFLWLNNTKKESQVIEKEDVKSNIIIKKEPIILEKKVEVVGGDTNHGAKGIKHDTKFIDVVGLCVPVNTNHGAETAEETIFEQRTLTDSVEIITPLTTKNIHADIENPTIILPIDQTPYYVKPIPKSRKKSIFRNVKISAGVGVYQQ